MTTGSSTVRSLFIAILITMFLSSCGGSVLPPEPDSEADEPVLSGEAGTATIRIERTGISTDVDWHWGITGQITSIWDVDFEVHGAFNAKDCSVEIYVKEVWAEGAEVTMEVEGVVLSGLTDEFIIFTDNTYEHKSIKFPLGIGQVTKPRTIGNTAWDATFTITSLSVPEFTGCGSFDYEEMDLDSSENGS
jgi:hypothetical protein